MSSNAYTVFTDKRGKVRVLRHRPPVWIGSIEATAAPLIGCQLPDGLHLHINEVWTPATDSKLRWTLRGAVQAYTNNLKNATDGN